MKLRALSTALLVAACTGPQRPRIAGAYRFECDPPDAHVVVDEVDHGPCVLWQRRWLGVTEGAHRFVVRALGYFPQESEVQPTGRRVTVRATLRPVPE